MKKLEEWYLSKQARYPYEITVIHMGREDIRPENYKSSYPFCRVPFKHKGISIWMFEEQEALDEFINFIGKR